MLNEMLTKQASQIKTAADQFRVLMGELDKLAFTPDPVRKIEGMDPLLAVRDYNAPVFKRHSSKPGSIDDLLAEKPLNTVAEVANLPSEAQEPPQPAEHGDDSRKSATERKAMGEQGFTWDPKAPFPKSDPAMSATNLKTIPGTEATAKPQPNISKSAGSRVQKAIQKLANQGRIQKTAAAPGPGYRSPTTWERFLGPESYMGEAIPLDPQERQDLYFKKTRWAVPAEMATSGVIGGIMGHNIGGVGGAALGAGTGALVGGGMTYGLRHLMAKRMAEKAREEAKVRQSEGR